MILAGDIGGTNTRLALFEKGALIGKEKIYPSPQYLSLEEIVGKFLKEEKIGVNRACFGIAGPVREGVCKTTNLPWVVSAKHMSQVLQIPSVFLLNDLEANAYGIRMLKKEEVVVLQTGKEQKGNQALIAAGTGLGEAGLYWNGKEHLPFACEGGHTDFAPRDDEEIALLQYLRKKFSHVSYERVVSGPGLQIIFEFLVETGRVKFADFVRDEMKQRNAAKVITEFGKQNRDLGCVQALDWFISLYGAESGNLALKTLSLGGLFVGGGIVPSIVDKMKTGPFLSSFSAKGRFQDLMESIPIRVILNDHAALLGAAYFAEK